jgi:hypothetical protein
MFSRWSVPIAFAVAAVSAAGCAEESPPPPAIIAIPTTTQNVSYTTNVYVAAPAPPAPAPVSAPSSAPVVVAPPAPLVAGMSTGLSSCDAFFLETLRCGDANANGDALDTLARSLIDERDRDRRIATHGTPSEKELLASTCEAALLAYRDAPCIARP